LAYDVPAGDVAEAARRSGVTLLGINTAPGRFDAGERGLGAVPVELGIPLATVDQFDRICRLSGATAIHRDGRQRCRSRSLTCSRRVLPTTCGLLRRKPLCIGSTLLLEALNPNDNPGISIRTPGRSVSLIEELALPNLKLQFDVYHVARSEGDVLAKLEKYCRHIGKRPDSGCAVARRAGRGRDQLFR